MRENQLKEIFANKYYLLLLTRIRHFRTHRIIFHAGVILMLITFSLACVLSQFLLACKNDIAIINLAYSNPCKFNQTV